MLLRLPLVIISLLLFAGFVHAQRDLIYSKEGDPIMEKRATVSNCLRSLNKNRSDAAALGACECYVSKLDMHFSNQEYKKNTAKSEFGSSAKVINIEKMINADPAFKKEVDNCFAETGKMMLMAAEGFRELSIERCITEIKKNTNKTLDSNKLKNFCSCQMDLISQKQLTDKEIETANDPNSLFFFEVQYKCGTPFADNDKIDHDWSAAAEKYIHGPLADTVAALELNGMSYLKIKIGSLMRIWLFDTGASDMLITTAMESTLRAENIISDSNYLGIGEYEMANGMIDTCRKYSINNVRIGKYYVDNIVVAVSEKTKRIIAGKTLLNKFSSWLLDNKTGTLILRK